MVPAQEIDGQIKSNHQPSSSGWKNAIQRPLCCRPISMMERMCGHWRLSWAATSIRSTIGAYWKRCASGFEHRRDLAAPMLSPLTTSSVCVVLDQVEFNCGSVGQYTAAVNPGGVYGQNSAHRRMLVNRIWRHAHQRLGRAHLPTLLSLGIGVAQETDGFNALLFHVLGHAVQHYYVRLRQTIVPHIFAGRQIGRHGQQLWCLAFHGDIGSRDAGRCGG
jgi:hypothetical protein